MKPINAPISTVSLDALKRVYENLMSDELPLDFAKTSAVIQAVGEVVRSYDLTTATRKPTRPRIVKIAGQRYITSNK
jgi:hypothetical protein